MPLTDSDFQAAAAKDSVVKVVDQALGLFPEATIPDTTTIEDHAQLIKSLSDLEGGWSGDSRIGATLAARFQAFYADTKTALTTLRDTVEAEKLAILNPSS